VKEEMAEQLYLRAPGEKRRMPRGMQAVIHLDEPGVKGYPLHHNLDACLVHPSPPPSMVSAFLLAALGVWAGDKLLPRSSRPDAWTREIVLHLPATPEWTGLFPQFARALNFLTGDLWTIKPREAHLNLGFAGRWEQPWQPEAVALFSGGLDSLGGAIDQLEAGRHLLLVSHHDYGQLASIQQNLARALAAHYGPERVQHLNLRVQFPEAPELTLRSRSLLYLALGLTAAAAFGPVMPLLLPENGWVSLNPPLTLNRLGTCTTRTTHPYFLEQITRLWRDAGIHHPLTNPYQHLTKGELLAQCRNRELLEKLARQSSSCARPVASRWRRRAGGECGYCYPCLMRRAALHRLGRDRGEDYLLDVLAGPETLKHRVRGRDLRALLLALRTWEENSEEVEGRVYWGEPGPDWSRKYGETKRLLNSGFQEIGQFFRDKGAASLKAYLGRP
jgi:7-cyano-7-deazaguanine synthase in queuosine biosynthesis